LVHKGDGHRQRLRERFLSAGLDGFQDYEVVELLLTLGTPRKDCKQAAKAALKRFKTLQGVIDAGEEALCEVSGIGPKNVFGLKLVRAVTDRYLEKKIIRKDPLSNSKALFDYLYHAMAPKDRECFKVLYLDAKNRVLASEVLFQGTLTASSVYPREVVKSALSHQAAAVIFAHNHPSGDPDPSAADFAVTQQLVFACMTMGITVHEHLVIGDQAYFSFADNGHIGRMCRQFWKEQSQWTGENER
jgi:DNA repair protein RadC